MRVFLLCVFIFVNIFILNNKDIFSQTSSQDNSSSQSESKEALQKQINERSKLIEQLEKEIKAYNDLANKSGKQAQNLKTYIGNLERQIATLNKDIEKSQILLDKTNLELRQISRDIEVNTSRIEKMKRAIEQSIYIQYESDNTSIFENILANKSILSSAEDIERISFVQSEIKKLTDSIKQEKNILENNKLEENEKKELLEDEKKELEKKQKSLDIVKSERKKELDVTKNQEKNYKLIVEEKRKKKIAFEREMFEYENKLKYILDTKSLPKSGSSPLAWPLKSVYITQNFGKTSASGRLYSSGTHNGTDFRAPVGTALYASADGRVAGYGDTDAICPSVSFGKWILIKHDNGLALTYGHLSSISVTNGQRVKAGDLIGYTGNSGYSTGPHLHISLYPNDAVNPISRPSASCPGKNLTMPVAAVSAYLDPLAYFPSR